MKVVSAALAAALLFATPAFAAGLIYDCDLPRTSSGKGWVPQKLALIVLDGGKVMVSDGLVLRIHGKPIPALSAKDSASALVVRWRLKGLKDTSNQTPPQMGYRAKVDKKTGVIAVNARPSDSPQNFRERGKCAQRKGISDKQLNRLLKR